ncbi:alpha/beta hydrolase [Amycolatopsis suaedae]|uniref:Alpha/beta hydrolase n=1 Tax=Amycolatopsis suaedae TaxID=2510978 RepID=A0A4Q7J8I5_9PSEU|nr:alpha/beta hydrolase [Amycolatopsis suaedae]
MSGGEVVTGTLGSGPPVVLTHGTPSWSYLWRDVAPELARTHTVYLWDQLGYGDSRIRPGLSPSFKLHGETLAELIAHWGLERPALVGHDSGGAAVMLAHLHHGVAVDRIALVDAAVLSPFVTPVSRHLRRYREAYSTMPVHVFTELIAAHLRSAVSGPADLIEPYLDRYRGEEGRESWIDHVVHFDEADVAPAESKLDSVDVPALVLWGEQDRWLPVETGRRLAASIPGATFEAIAGAGHFLPEDAPGEVAARLREFLA